MNLLIIGICGFVDSTVACALQVQRRTDGSLNLFDVDNFSRPGSESNRQELKRQGIELFHGDLRAASDLIVQHAVAHEDWLDLSADL